MKHQHQIITAVFLLFVLSIAYGQQPKVATGSIDHYENFRSKYVAARNVDVWLPDGYTDREYAVVYMNDGQMLFDSTITWNHQEWGVDETVGRLLRKKKIKDCIVVGIWSIAEKRYADYFPDRIMDSIPPAIKQTILTEQIKGSPNGDNYLKFLVTELKPFIDSAYHTLKDQPNTFIMGSSMGGLISVYALCEYPRIFGGAAGLSTHLPVVSYRLLNKNTDAAAQFSSYLNNHLPAPDSHKIYLDYGDQDHDAIYKPYHDALDTIKKQKGYTNKNWQTKFFAGAGHAEKWWAKRLDVPVRFLLRK